MEETEQKLNDLIYKMEELTSEFNNIILLGSDLIGIAANLNKFSKEK